MAKKRKEKSLKEQIAQHKKFMKGKEEIPITKEDFDKALGKMVKRS